MKQLELELKKRLLIVEVPRLADYEFINKDSKYLKIGNEEIKLNIPTLCKLEIVCKGSELTEEIAKTIALKSMNQHWRNLNRKKEDFSDLWFNSSVQSFISAIEANGFCFGFFSSLSAYKGKFDNWDEAESRTFNPEKTLIFEIL